MSDWEIVEEALKQKLATELGMGRSPQDAMPEAREVVAALGLLRAREQELEEALKQAGRYATDARDSLDEDEMEDGEPSITAARLMSIEMVARAALEPRTEA